ncbi:hypothetical protein C2845_PM09G09320 [Panicum miliaceum]|uniref:Pentatricopeptide repeat-containing protein n=1 Tax=Panicum miliaceum TaxID=4540 RepID=A0A3L6RZJ7_PANMI|nr:hypothetical protein C2845_PM09G09320 [Panicum miliaceum]
MLTHSRAALVRAVAACAGYREAQALHCLAWKLGLASDVVLATALLTRYAKRGLLAPAQRLFDEMSRRDVVACNAVLAALGAAGRAADARALFERMPDRTPASWNAMVTCHCRAGDLVSARRVFEASLHAGSSSVVSWNAMIDGYCKAGRMDAARDLFDRMGSTLPDVVTWNTMMAGYLHGGEPAAAIATFHRLMHIHQEQQQEEEEHRLRPTTVTMATVVTACTQVGDFALGWQIHHQIRQQGTGIDAVLSNALMDMYFKGGSADSALDARAPERQEDGIRLSERAARRISEMDVWDGAAYGLSNVYASLQRWDRVEEHRRGGARGRGTRQGHAPQAARACLL